MDQATESQFQLFRTLANPDRTDFNQTHPAPILETVPEVPERPPSPFVAAPINAPSESHSERKRKKKKKKKKRERDTPPPSESGQSKRSRSDGIDGSEYSKTKPGKAEKLQYLMNLKRLRQQGCVLTREYSTEDRLEEIKYEFERQKMNLDTVNGVSLLKDGFKLGCSGIEMVNNKLGPFLKLNGWSEHVTKDMSRFDSVLTRIYLKYMNRTTSMNPIVELGFLLCGSLLMFHFQNSVFGGVAKEAPSAPPPSVPIDRNMQPPERRRATMKRPTMRRPGMFENLNQPPPSRFSSPQEDSTPEFRQIDEEKGPAIQQISEVERVDDDDQPPQVVDTEVEEQKMEDIGDALNFDM